MEDSDFIPISALQHWRVCPRQCALIHLLGVWQENRYTAEGRVFHQHVHETGGQCRSGVRTEHGLQLCSQALGLTGQADVVEFRVELPPFPVEYKRGKPKHDSTDAVQLCAQAMCLEEMLQTSIPKGALFYGASRRRLEVEFTPELRKEVRELTLAIRSMLRQDALPKVQHIPRCEGCSLATYCREYPSIGNYLQKALAEC